MYKVFAYRVTVANVLKHGQEWGWDIDKWKGLPLDNEYVILSDQYILGILRATVMIVTVGEILDHWEEWGWEAEDIEDSKDRPLDEEHVLIPNIDDPTNWSEA